MFVSDRLAKLVAAIRRTSLGQSRSLVTASSLDTIESWRFTWGLSGPFGNPPPRVWSTFQGNLPLLLSAQRRMAKEICLWLFAQAMRCALAFARLSAGKRMARRIAIVA